MRLHLRSFGLGVRIFLLLSASFLLPFLLGNQQIRGMVAVNVDVGQDGPKSDCDISICDGGLGTGEGGNDRLWKNDAPLERARKLEPPVPRSTQNGDAEGAEWWLAHDTLLRSAWRAWDRQSGALPGLGPESIDPDLRASVERTRTEPTPEHEAALHRIWDEVLVSSLADGATPLDDHHRHHHGVFRYRGFFTVDGIARLRSHLDAVSNSGIPWRRPNAMNRNGLLLDPSVPGGVSGDPELQRFVELLANEYLRPLGRAFFPDFAGNPMDDSKQYAFTINYGTSKGTSSKSSKTTTTIQNRNGTDWDLKEHSDASVYTLNINLNLPGEGYSGSSLYFLARSTTGNPQTAVHEVDFEPGTALLHRGMTRHGAQPLKGGGRKNLVIWLHGIDGYVRIAPYPKEERLSLEERWSSSSSSSAAAAAANDEFHHPFEL